MRQHNLVTKIVALVALLTLILPSSVQAALCHVQPVGMKCCKAQKAKPVVKAEDHSCCASKAVAPVSGPEIKADDRCHCTMKQAPVTNPGEGLTPSFTVSQDPIDYPVALMPVMNQVEEAQAKETCFISGDSSPPLDPASSPSVGRAPPVR